MIGLSLLSTGHPPSFQPRWVRPSTGSYPRFSLPMGSSPGFASAARDLAPCSDSLSLRLASWLGLATRRNSLAHSTKGTPSHRPKAMLRLLVGRRFQVLFHSPPGVLFTFPSRYWFAIGHRRVFSLGGWSPLLRTGFHVPGPTQVPARSGTWVRVRGFDPLRPALPCRSAPHARPRGAPAGAPWPVLQPRWREGCRPRALTGLS